MQRDQQIFMGAYKEYWPLAREGVNMERTASKVEIDESAYEQAKTPPARSQSSNRKRQDA